MVKAKRRHFWSIPLGYSNGGGRVTIETKKKSFSFTAEMTADTAKNQDIVIPAPSAGKSNYVNLVRYYFNPPASILGHLCVGMSTNKAEADRVSLKATIEKDTTFACCVLDALTFVGADWWCYDVFIPEKGIKLTDSCAFLIESDVTMTSLGMAVEVYYHEE